ncbi:MAG TPA: PRC and DUF2382 domain-containing protein [Kineosporiaceae bacterium]
MIAVEQLPELYGHDVTDLRGTKIGTVGTFWMDETSGRPSWASVRTGLFGMHESLVPLFGAEIEEDRIRVPYAKDQVKDAPNVDASSDEPLGPEAVDRLYQHYHISGQGAEAGSRASQQPVTESGSGDVARGDEAMTRSEEQLRVGTERQAAGTARLRKYVVTEPVQVTVPVSHEEPRVVREPITDANRDAAMAGPELSGAEHEVTLHAERPVVEKETVPVERVQLGTETVTEEQQVQEQLRRERIDTDLSDDTDRG